MWTHSKAFWESLSLRLRELLIAQFDIYCSSDHIKRYDESGMKPLAPPAVPGSTDAERMDAAVRKMFSVSKDALLKEDAKWSKARARKKRAKKS
jgi:hypothetical protein